MKEFDDFIQSCIDKYTACEKCADNCVHGHYCIQMGCGESNCKECLKQIQWGKGLFTYECRKITFHYVLRFFYRFASIEKIKVYGCSVSLHNYHFSRDKRLGNIKWKLHPSDKLLFTVNPCNPVSYNHVCNSKQVFCYIRY